MADTSGNDLADREQLREDIKRSESLRADIREKLARGKDRDLLADWQNIERLDLDIGRRLRRLKTSSTPWG
jgi:hypothetical protein